MKIASPRLLARLAGLFFLVTIIGGIIAQGFISERLIDFSDAVATANNILANKGLFQIGFTVYLIEMACQVITAALWYRLLSPVNRTLALVMLSVDLTGCVIKTFARVFYITPLFVLGGATALSGLDAGQLQSISLILLRANDYGAAIALAFFGLSTVMSGYLVFRSTYLPRWLGVLSMVSGLGWLTFFYPPLGYAVFMFAALVGLLSAVAKIFWLLVFGVDEAKFRAVETRMNDQAPFAGTGRAFV
ncbi:MAG: DUF4386 domain-containing protein [Pyrinomonadaceae bacterium]